MDLVVIRVGLTVERQGVLGGRTAQGRQQGQLRR